VTVRVAGPCGRPRRSTTLSRQEDWRGRASSACTGTSRTAPSPRPAASTPTGPGRWLTMGVGVGAETHLMVTDPLAHVDAWTDFCGVRPALALSPGTGLDTVPSQELPVLVMSVQPGHGGSTFLPSTYDRLRQLAGTRLLGVDGGVDQQAALRSRAAGANWVVSGTALLNSPDPAQWIRSVDGPRAERSWAVPGTTRVDRTRSAGAGDRLSPSSDQPSCGTVTLMKRLGMSWVRPYASTTPSWAPLRPQGSLRDRFATPTRSAFGRSLTATSRSGAPKNRRGTARKSEGRPLDRPRSFRMTCGNAGQRPFSLPAEMDFFVRLIGADAVLRGVVIPPAPTTPDEPR
jgi:ribulose-phosphate 3-epimerase